MHFVHINNHIENAQLTVMSPDYILNLLEIHFLIMLRILWFQVKGASPKDFEPMLCQ